MPVKPPIAGPVLFERGLLLVLLELLMTIRRPVTALHHQVRSIADPQNDTITHNHRHHAARPKALSVRLTRKKKKEKKGDSKKKPTPLPSPEKPKQPPASQTIIT